MKNLNLIEKCNQRIAKRVTLIAVLLAMCIPQMWAYWYIPGSGWTWSVDDGSKMNEENYITYYALPAGTYTFKVAEKSTGDANWFTGNPTEGSDANNVMTITKGAKEGDNNTLVLTQTADVQFDLTSEVYKDVTVNAYPPTYFIKYDFGNSGWTWRQLDANGDGTYSCTGKYSGWFSGDVYNYYKRTSNSDTWCSTGTASDVTRVNSPSSTSDNCIFTYNPSTKKLTIRKCNSVAKTNHIYFDNANANWTKTYMYFVIGRPRDNSGNQYSKMYRINQISNTMLWYVSNSSDDWGDPGYYAIAGGDGAWDEETGWGISSISGWDKHSAPYLSTFNMANSDIVVVGKENGTNGEAITMTKKGTSGSLNGALNNNTITYQYSFSTNGEDYHNMSGSDGKTPGAIKMEWYKYNTVSSVNKQSDKTTSANGGTYSQNTGSNAGYRAAVKMTESNTVDGYTFVGWHDGTSLMSSSNPYTFYPSGTMTVYARFRTNIYTVVFNKNDVSATGTMANQTHYYGAEKALTSNGYSHPTKVFAGWATSEGGAVVYTDGQSVTNLSSTDGATVNLYAKWGYALTYDKNTSDAVTNMPSSGAAMPGSTTLDSKIPVRSGYVFVGWQVGGAGTIYQPGGSYTMPSSAVTMKAKWVAENMKITDAGKSGSWESDKVNGNEITSTHIDGTILGGTVVCTNASSDLKGNDKNGFVFDEDVDEITITVLGKVFAAGSAIVIGAKGTDSDKSHTCGFVVSSNPPSPATVTSSTSANDFRQVYIVTAGDGIIGTNSFTIKRKGSSDKIYLKYLYVGGCEEPSCTKPIITENSLGTSGEVTHNTATLAWDGNGAPVGTQSYKIYLYNRSTSSVVQDWTAYVNTSKTYSDLSPNTDYTFKVKPVGNPSDATNPRCEEGDEYSVNFETTAAPSCSAPTSPSITGTTTYTAGQTISLTASATGTDESTTYEWWLGDPTNGGTKKQNASTSGATFSKASCGVADEGTYYCVISNGADCSVTVSKAINVKCTVAYNTNGGTGSAPTDGDSPYASSARVTVKEPGSISKAGNTFIGWNTAPDGSGTYYSPKAHFAITENTTLYAVWQEKSTALTPAGGTLFSIAMNNRAESGLGLAAGRAERVSWHGTVTKGEASFTNTHGSTDNNAAIYKGSPAQLSFYSDYAMLALYLDYPLQQGDVISFTSLENEQLCFTTTTTRATTISTSAKSYTIPAESPLIGQSIVYAWRKSGDPKVTAFTITRPASNYTITLDNNDATYAGTENIAVTYNSTTNVTTGESPAITLPTKTGHNFGGYYNTDDFSDKQIINANGWFNYDVTDYTYDGAWIYDGSVTLYAKWTPKTYSITLEAGDGGTDGSATATYGATALSDIVLPTKAGYTLNEFYEGKGLPALKADGSYYADNVSDGNGYKYIEDGKWVADGDQTFTADWNVTVYHVTYAAGGATGNVPVNSTDYTGGETVTVSGNVGTPSPLSKAGYSFGGWSANVDLTIDAAVVTAGTTIAVGKTFPMPAVDVTLTAVWNINNYDLTWDLAGGTTTSAGTGITSGVSVNTTASVEYGATLSAPSVEKTGYTFSVWSPSVAATMPAANTTYTATWTANTYTITYVLYDSEEGSVSGKTSYQITDEDYDLPTPEWTGHTFLGWYETFNEGTGAYSDPVSVLTSGSTGDKTYHAKWATSAPVEWTITKVSSKLYAGGGGYSVKAVVDDASWTGAASSLVLSASDGVTLGTPTTSTVSSKKQIVANFSIGCDVEGPITFSLYAPADGSYAAIEDEEEVELDACSSGGGVSVAFTTSNKNDAGSNFADMSTSSNTTQLVGGGVAKIIAVGDAKIGSNDKKSGYRSDGRLVMVFKLTKASDLDIYFCASNSGLGFTLYSFSSSKALTSIGPSDYETKSAVTSGTAEKASFGTCTTAAGSAGFNSTSGAATISSSGGGIKVSYSLESGYYVAINSSGSESYFYGFDIDGGASGSSAIATSLSWSGDDASAATAGTVNKNDISPDFTLSATRSTNSIGAITYTSSNTSVATVDEAGKVHIINSGTTTITATLAACGCYGGDEISYSLVVENTCSDTPGTIVNNDGSAIAGNAISRGACETLTLRLTGHTGSTIQWMKDGENVCTNSDTYVVPNGESGVYTATVTGACTLEATNSITVTTAGSVNPTIYADDFYVKDGKWFGYRLMKINEGETVSVTDAPDGWEENTDFFITTDASGIVSIRGRKTISTPSNKTLTLTISNACDGSVDKDITIREMAATPIPTIAWIATDSDNKGKVDKVKADESTNTGLYKELENDYTITTRNCYWTTNEAELVKEYSQYDLIILTDYPNSKTGPNGSTSSSTSYTNAIGLLIDHKPILTFEAYVAGCPNWGIASNPKNTEATQNTLTLLCNANDIFGTDATFNAGASINAATVASGQSLQGFPVASSPDFVFIGKITDSDTKEYVACCERQVQTEARMMVFGLNSAIMSSMTDLGKQMVHGFVDYLLLDNAASIPDCSVIFNGGGSDNSWYTTANWEANSLPDAYASVRIDAPCVIPEDADAAKAGRIKIHKGGAFTGSLTIEPKGRLIVEKTITRVENDEYTVHKPTQPSDLVIQSDATGNGVLVMGSYDGTNQATVAFYTKAHKDENGWINQFIGTPFSPGNDIYQDYYGSYIYEFDPTKPEPKTADENDPRWINKKRGYHSVAFQGYNILRKDAAGTTLSLEGQLCASEPKTLNLYYNGSPKTENMFANSWMAPIDVASMSDAFTNCEKTIYIFNAGSKTQIAAAGVGAANATSAGQYIVLPVESAPWTSPTVKVIPSMQAFSVLATGAGAKLNLDYATMVLEPAKSASQADLTAATRAPNRRMDDVNKPEIMRLQVTGDGGYGDLVYMLMRSDFTTEFENGYDGRKMMGDGAAPQMYAISDAGNMSINCVADADGTVIGFQPGEDTQYTFTFAYDGDEDMYLNDIKKNKSVQIREDRTYMFTADEGDEINRFIISATPFNSPEIATGVTDLDADAPKVQKIIYNDKLYIIRGGKVFSADGQLVK